MTTGATVFLSNAGFMVFELICMIDCDDDTVSDYDHMANARLVAAAPDLLQALQWLVCEADEDMPSECRSDSFTSALDAAIAAITKARGA